MFDIDHCLDRINYQGSREPLLQTLQDLQLAFVRSVPFENLDIHLGRTIELSVDKIFEKIVRGRRGGFCYECNALFHAILDSLGFDVTYVAATMQLAIAMNIEFEHMALLVSLDRDYLVDAGNGQSSLRPMQIGSDEVANFESIDYRLDKFEDRFALYFKREGKNWTPRYSFTTTPRELEQFAEMCNIIQTSKESQFTQKKVLTFAKTDGRVTLADRDLEITRLGKTEARQLSSNAEYIQALESYFNIHLAFVPESW
jgi:N-hydroxyarylamine O-acetyltransferase